MNTDGLVLGLLDNSAEIGDAQLAAKYRGLTISWSRFGYHGLIIEAQTVEALLAEAQSRGFHFCLIQSYGHVIQERWTPENWQERDFFAALDASIRESDFLVMGPIVDGGDDWFGFEPGCLLVNLEKYQQLGCPGFESGSSETVELPEAIAVVEHGRLSALHGCTGTVVRRPCLPGWRLIQASLQAGLPVVDFSDEVRYYSLYLPIQPNEQASFVRFLGAGISQYGDAPGPAELRQVQHEFLQAVHSQASNARRGVFLWNIESYQDVESPPPGFRQPISTLYSVAAGFKPNRILHSFGFDQHTRVVYFDYSPHALAVRKYLVECWAGDDFPDFVRCIFDEFPHPETFYQLWDGRTPEDVDWNDITEICCRELSRWGGPGPLHDHWQAYRQLEHTYICCDLLQDPGPLLGKMISEPGSVIWWSNAFFTVYGNWFYSLDHRRRTYERWIEQLATQNPQLFMYGSDYTNANVNCFQAEDYRQYYLREGADDLKPLCAYQTQIRM